MTLPTGAPGAGRPVRGITVLYDARCRVCCWVRDWLLRQPTYVAVQLVPAASPDARRHFPWLDHSRTLSEVTVVGDGGEVWTGDGAWIACLWATRAHRAAAVRLASSPGRPLARAAVVAACGFRAVAGSGGDVCDAGG